jgi:hypothetical protein
MNYSLKKQKFFIGAPAGNGEGNQCDHPQAGFSI